MEPLLILVDGYNVIKNTPGLAAADRASISAGRAALLAQLAAKYRHTPHRVVVVFDGDGEVERVEALGGRARGQVIFTARGVTADETLHRLAAEATSRGERVTVVSADGDVRDNVAASGAYTARPQELAARLNQPARDVQRRGRHRAAVKVQLEARDAADDQASSRPKKGNPRRASRRNRGSRDSGL